MVMGPDYQSIGLVFKAIIWFHVQPFIFPRTIKSGSGIPEGQSG